MMVGFYGALGPCNRTPQQDHAFMAKGLCGSRAFKIGRGSLGSFRMDTLL